MKIVFDPKLMKVGCVLLQSAYGCGKPNLAHHFDTKDWAIAPTPDMGVFEVTREQLDKLVTKTREARIT